MFAALFNLSNALIFYEEVIFLFFSYFSLLVISKGTCAWSKSATMREL